jgi:hypothetical protein
MTRSLYLDHDGVMADFDGGFPAMFGFDHRAAGDDVMWKTIHDYGSFFRDLPVCEGALEFYESVRPHVTAILTACPKDDFENIAKQKIGWVREHIGDVQIILTPGGKSKPLYMRNPGDVLVDDFPANTERWGKAGGIGILHTGDFGQTLTFLAGFQWPNKNPSASAMSPAPSAAPETTSPDTVTDTDIASGVDTENAALNRTAAAYALLLGADRA